MKQTFAAHFVGFFVAILANFVFAIGSEGPLEASKEEIQAVAGRAIANRHAFTHFVCKFDVRKGNVKNKDALIRGEFDLVHGTGKGKWCCWEGEELFTVQTETDLRPIPLEHGGQTVFAPPITGGHILLRHGPDGMRLSKDTASGTLEPFEDLGEVDFFPITSFGVVITGKVGDPAEYVLSWLEPFPGLSRRLVHEGQLTTFLTDGGQFTARVQFDDGQSGLATVFEMAHKESGTVFAGCYTLSSIAVPDVGYFPSHVVAFAGSDETSWVAYEFRIRDFANTHPTAEDFSIPTDRQYVVRQHPLSPAPFTVIPVGYRLSPDSVDVIRDALDGKVTLGGNAANLPQVSESFPWLKLFVPCAVFLGLCVSAQVVRTRYNRLRPSRDLK